MTIHLPEELENSLRGEVESGHFASMDDAIAEAVRRLLRDQKADPPLSRSSADDPTILDPVLGSMRDAADELDAIVEDAMRRRREEPWRVIPGV